MTSNKISKFLSLVLRHDPGQIGITLDAQGWVDCEVLIPAAIAHGVPLDMPTLAGIVKDSDKQRFSLSEDGSRIRANQGHSVQVDLALAVRNPPETLFHGTPAKFLDAILLEGLRKGERHHVHLSSDPKVATQVGSRRGKPVVLMITAGKMARAGFDFYRSDNGVWLTDHVPEKYIEAAPKTITLYRPVGPKELTLIKDSGWKKFPPRLPDQPIFYPVTNEDYAIQIARDWNLKASGSGFVTKFEVSFDYVSSFEVQTVGGSQHQELWIPAEELEEFNRHIVGLIEVTHRFPENTNG